MKRTMLAFAVALTFFVASAQNEHKMPKDKPELTPEQRAQKETDRMDKTVGLSAEQKTKVYDLSLEKAKKAATLHEKMKAKEDEKEVYRSEMKSIREDYKKNIDAILSPEQKATLDAKHKEKMAMHEKKHPKLSPEERADKHVQKLDEDLKFTPEQKEQVKTFALDKANKTQAVREKYKDQPEQKDEVKKEMKAIHKQFHDQLQTVLTKEQKDILKAKHKEKQAERKGKNMNTPPAINDQPVQKN